MIDRRTALTHLHIALRELADPVHRKFVREDGQIATHTAPSLLDQLRAATGTSGETGGGGRGTHGLPVDPAAVDLLADLAVAAVHVHRDALRYSPKPIEHFARHAVALAEQWLDPKAIEWLTGELTRWRRAITGVLDPPRRWHLAAACPACGMRLVRVDLDNADVMQPALLVDADTGCTCRACGAHWKPEQLEHLALVIRTEAARGTRVPSDAQTLDAGSNMAQPPAPGQTEQSSADWLRPPSVRDYQHRRCELTDLLVSQCAHCRAARSRPDLAVNDTNGVTDVP